MWALAKMGHKEETRAGEGSGFGESTLHGNGQWTEAALSRAASLARTLSPRDLSNLLWAVVRLSGANKKPSSRSGLRHVEEPGLLRKAPEPDTLISSLGISNIGSSGSRNAGSSWNGEGLIVEQSWIATMMSPIASSEAALSRVSPRDAAEMLWSIGRIGVSPPARVVHALLYRFTRFVPRHHHSALQQRQQSISSASLPSRSSPSLSQPPAICPQDVANVCWALAALQFQPHERLQGALMEQIQWVLQIQIQNTSIEDKVQSRDHARRRREVGQAIPVILWAMARLDGWAGREPVALASAARSLSASLTLSFKGHGVKPSSPWNGPLLTPQGTSMVLYCFARSGYHPRQELVSLLLRQLPLGEPEEEEGPHDIYGPGEDPDALLAAVNKGKHQTPPVKHSGRRSTGTGSSNRSPIAELSAQTAALVLWSLGKLDFRPSDSWIRRLLVHTVHLLPRSTPQEICNLAKGLAMLR